MQVQSEEKPYDDINITPMVDLTFVLLVIFILMCTASVAGTKVNLPKGGAATKSMTAPKTKAISVNNEGKIFLETQAVTLAELEQRLGAMKAKGEFPVVIRGDSVTQYQSVMDVINVVGGLGISQVGLATKPSGAK